MDQQVIIALVLLFIFTVLFLFFFYLQRRRNGKTNLTRSKGELVDSNCEENDQINLPVSIEQLPSDVDYDSSRLYEIKDSNLLVKLNTSIPALAQAAAKSITKQGAEKLGGLYLAKIPKGEHLAKSLDMDGAVRGIYHGKEGIAGHANLVKVDASSVTKGARIANTISSVMNITSLVVGQYFMSEVSSQLKNLNKEINKIGDFQNREFKSKIMSLIIKVEKISRFSSEIIERDELRLRKLAQLDDFENETIQLLQQVNLTLEEEIIRKVNINYKEYQSSVNEFEKLTGYQKTLVLIQSEISKLIYALNLGHISSEMCYSTYMDLLEQSNRVRMQLHDWHGNHFMSIGIEVDRNRVTKKGLEGAVAKVPGLIDKKWHFKKLDVNLKKKMLDQFLVQIDDPGKPESVFDKDVEIIIKDGRYYYLQNK